MKYKIIVKDEYKTMYAQHEIECENIRYDSENNIFIIIRGQEIGRYALEHVTIKEL